VLGAGAEAALGASEARTAFAEAAGMLDEMGAVDGAARVGSPLPVERQATSSSESARDS
jgi:hypothetical protein